MGCGNLRARMIQAFIFDIGNVLLHFDFAPAVEHFRTHSQIPFEAAHDELERVKLSYERGGLSTDAFIDEIGSVLGYQGTREEFVEAYQNIFTPIEATHQLAASLSAHYPLYLLSNTSQLHVDFFEREYSVFQYFSGSVYSHLVNLSKPEPGIYQLTLERFQLDPARTVFIDDLPANIAAGREAGLHAIQYDFHNHQDLISSLKQLGVKELP